MKATRDGFGDQLAAMKDNPRLVVVNADLGKATKAAKFGEVCPERFFEVGIAEANMIGIASGLSEYGYRVVISSFASFLTGRYDIIRCSLAYPQRPVIIVGSHSGMAIGKDGVTQMGLEDLNVMRGIPNICIFQPATYLEARQITEYLIKSNMLAYMRIGRQPCEEIFNDNYEFEFSRGKIITKGNGEIVIFSSGCVLESCLQAGGYLDASVVNMPTIKPIDHRIISYCAKTAKLVVTVEDHSVIGGLGTAVGEVMIKSSYTAPLLKIGIQDCFVESGKPDDLYDKYGLSAMKIVQQIQSSEFFHTM